MQRGSATGRRCLWRDGWESHLVICQAHDLPLGKPSGGESWVLREKPPGRVGTERREDLSWAWTVSTTLFKLEGHRLYIWTKRGPGTGSRSPRNHCPTSWSNTETASPLSWGSFNRMPGRPQTDPPYRNGLFLLTSLPPGPLCRPTVAHHPTPWLQGLKPTLSNLHFSPFRAAMGGLGL